MLEDYLRAKLASQPLQLMAHAVVGYPSLDDNWRMLEAMRNAGVALVELQLPFSEPIADGPLFVRANQIALEQGLRWREYFDFLTLSAREFGFPVLFMGYYNSVFCMGEDRFIDRLHEAGAAGYIIADLPPQYAVYLDTRARSAGIDPIHLMTPTNSAARLLEISRNASGFIYCVARKGVTGKKTELDQGVTDYVGRCRTATRLPIALGFGIKTSEDIRMLRGHVDIAIVGTACLESWEQGGESAYREFLDGLGEAARE